MTMNYVDDKTPVANQYSYWKLAVGVLGFIVLNIVINLILGVALPLVGRENFTIVYSIPLSALSFFLSAALIILIGNRSFKNLFSLFSFSNLRWGHVFTGLGFGILAYILASVIGIIVSSIMGPNSIGTNNTGSSLMGLDSGVRIFMGIAFTAFLTPIAEEFFFRGAILGSIVQDSKNTWVKLSGIIFVSVLFAFAHYQGAFTTTGDVMSVLAPGAVGLVCAILTVWKKSIYPAIFTHMVYNGIVFALLSYVNFS